MKRNHKLSIPDIVFDFDTDSEYMEARFTGYIPSYKIGRICRKHSNGMSVDYPCHSREEFVKAIDMWIKDDTVVSIDAYQDIHSYDINDYE